MHDHEPCYLLSRNLKKYRNYRGLSQAELAEKLEISIPFLSDVENGKKWVSANTISKIASNLNVEIYELFKPDTLAPDNLSDFIEKYSDDIVKIFNLSVENLKNEYFDKIITEKEGKV